MINSKAGAILENKVEKCKRKENRANIFIIFLEKGFNAILIACT